MAQRHRLGEGRRDAGRVYFRPAGPARDGQAARFGMSSTGAYRRDDNPSVVFAYARPSAPGGRFAATRIGGIWRAVEPTIGELEEGYTRITDGAEVASLLSMARATLD